MITPGDAAFLEEAQKEGGGAEGGGKEEREVTWVKREKDITERRGRKGQVRSGKVR